jgi:hypothetical protein
MEQLVMAPVPRRTTKDWLTYADRGLAWVVCQLANNDQCGRTPLITGSAGKRVSD